MIRREIFFRQPGVDKNCLEVAQKKMIEKERMKENEADEKKEPFAMADSVDFGRGGYSSRQNLKCNR